LSKDLHPYVVFLPSGEKTRILGGIFGSRAAVDVLRFSLSQGVSGKIYQKDLVSRLNYSNKTVIKNLKSLTRLGILNEEMEKLEKGKRTVWVKTYKLTDSGKWFALLLAEEKDMPEAEKADILQSLFRAYVRWVKGVSNTLHVDMQTLRRIFKEEMEHTEDEG
jgi:DNA-binding PadR family transcriptional regulator